MIFGVDTASVAGNKNPDWAKAKAGGPISFAIVRSNYGTATDSVFARDWPKLKQAGLVRGAYLFLRFPRGNKPAPTPEAQAQAAIDTIGDLEDGDLPPTVDVEFPGRGRVETGMSAQACLDGVRAAWDVLQSHYGVAPLVYTSARVWRDDLGNAPADDLTESPLWLARTSSSRDRRRATRPPSRAASGIRPSRRRGAMPTTGGFTSTRETR